MSKKTLEHFRASMWWNPFTVDHLTLISPLTPAECTQRIQAHTYQSPWGPAYWQESDPALLFAGIVGDSLFTLAKLTPGFRNTFRPILYGTILPETGGGASIRLALSEFPLAMLFGIVYPLYVFSTLLSFKEQEFLVNSVAQLLEASDDPELSVSGFLVGSGGGAAASVIWAIVWLLLIGPFGVLLLSKGAPFMDSTVLGRWILDGAYLGFWFGGVAFFLYRALRQRASKKS
ncbi:MAG: hypothetical protein ACLQUY_23445 [Ktedonobacterales bacterium]